MGEIFTADEEVQTMIQDKDITAMIEFLKGTGWSGLLVAELTAMLEELLLLRKKVRDAA